MKKTRHLKSSQKHWRQTILIVWIRLRESWKDLKQGEMRRIMRLIVKGETSIA